MATPKKLHELLNHLVPSSIIQYNNNNNHHSSNNILSKLTPLLIQVKNNVPSQSEYEQISNLLDKALENGEKINVLKLDDISINDDRKVIGIKIGPASKEFNREKLGPI